MKRYQIRLDDEERQALEALVRKGRTAARTLTRARILLKADEGPKPPEHEHPERAEDGAASPGGRGGHGGRGWTDEAIAEALDVSRATVERVRKRAVLDGVPAALTRRPAAARPQRTLDGRAEAHLIALACGVHGPPPGGREGWTLRLLADTLVELEYVDAVSYETVRRTLKKTSSSLT